MFILRFSLILFLTVFCCNLAFAAVKPMDFSDTSVLHLKKIVDSSKEIRKDDLPMIMPDMSLDISSTKEAKENFYKDYKIFNLQEKNEQK